MNETRTGNRTADLQLEADSFAGARVLLVGDVMLDRYWSGGTDRISPEAPVPVVGLRDFRDLPGGAANVALNVAALGARAALIGFVGADESARTLRDALDATTVDHELIAVAGSPTITKLRVLSRNQHLMRLDIEDGFGATEHDSLASACRRRLPGSDVLVLSDYAKGTLGAIVPDLIAAAHEAGVPVLVDPKGVDYARYSGADLMTPNRSEFELVVGRCNDNADIERRARVLLEEFDIGGLLITRSEEGMSLIPKGGEALHLPAHRREVYDVTGAGDTVIGVVAAGIAAGMKTADTVTLANHAAAIVVGRLGAAQVTVDELAGALADVRRTHEPGGVVALEDLLARVRSARQRGETIVMTNGCFDLLHVGHLESLRAMKAMGDRLVVAVNDDDSVTRLKGAGRPLVPVTERMALLAALDCVDWVVSFSEDTPAGLISRVRPDVLAKGGDYGAEDIAGHDTVTSYGGRVEIVAYRPDCSTSALIERIRGMA